MSSNSGARYSDRAKSHRSKLARRLFEIAEAKKSNLVVSADLTTTAKLLQCADELGPYIAVFKTHIDLVSDFGEETVTGLRRLAEKHNFLIFEDRKLVDIGNTVQMQYHGGALRISEWAHIVNLSILGGEGIVQALDQVVSDSSFPYKGDRGFLILAEMTSKGSLATGSYTGKCVDAARQYRDSVIGFVAVRSLANTPSASKPSDDEDFVVFTTGINIASKGDELGQQYQTPKHAIQGGSDFVIAGRGIYAATDPVAAAKQYQQEGWAAYEERVTTSS